MALSEGTNYSYTPPKPPKPQVQYGAPSGPYAAPLASPAAVSMAHLQQTIQQPMQGPWRGMGQTELQRLGDPFAQDYAFAAYKRGLRQIPHSKNPWEQRFMQGFWGTFDPHNYTPSKLYEGGKYAVQHPMDVLKTTFTTPEGLGGLTSGAAVTAATGGAAAPTFANRLSKAGKAAELADNVASQSQVAARMSGRGGYGIPNRDAMLNFADEQGYTLGSMLRGEQAPHYNPQMTTQKTAGRFAPPNPASAGRMFDYTGNLRHIDSREHFDEINDIMGNFEIRSDSMHERGGIHPDDAGPMDNGHPHYDTGGEYDDALDAFEEPFTATNVHDQYGNLVGSGTHSYSFGLGQHNIFHGGEAYVRPEYRGQVGPLRELLKPAMELGPNWKIDATFANDDLAKLALAMEKKGRIKLTDESRARAIHRDPTRQGTPGANGLYPYEVNPSYLPALLRGPGGLLGNLFRSSTHYGGSY